MIIDGKKHSIFMKNWWKLHKDSSMIKNRNKKISKHAKNFYQTSEGKISKKNQNRKLLEFYQTKKGKLAAKETSRKAIIRQNDPEWKNTIGKLKNEKQKISIRKFYQTNEGKNTRKKANKKLLNFYQTKAGEINKQKLRDVRAKQILPKKDTSIEVKIQNFLKQLGISYFTHQYMKIEHGYQCDILIPSMNLVIECDGDYWHKYPIGMEIDHIRTSEMLSKGFKVLRLWEREIKIMDINSFQNKLNQQQIISI